MVFRLVSFEGNLKRVPSLNTSQQCVTKWSQERMRPPSHPLFQLRGSPFGSFSKPKLNIPNKAVDGFYVFKQAIFKRLNTRSYISPFQYRPRKSHCNWPNKGVVQTRKRGFIWESLLDGMVTRMSQEDQLQEGYSFDRVAPFDPVKVENCYRPNQEDQSLFSLRRPQPCVNSEAISTLLQKKFLGLAARVLL